MTGRESHREMDVFDIASLLKVCPADAHKGVLGHALLYAGSRGIAGCAVLAAEACLRSGIGKLTVLTDEANRIVLQTAVPEAIVTDSMPLPPLPHQALGIGPGIGLCNYEQVRCLLSDTSQPLVLDADALHITASHRDIAEMISGRAVLTPHGGEMKHLASALCTESTDMLLAASELAVRYQVVVVHKGHPSRVCLPDGSAIACPRGNAGMATAGSGDVLTGIITALLARGYDLTDAAKLGVWLHASAGDYAAAELGQECLLARDIIRHLPQAFRELHDNKTN